jgi:hypothetical protein
MDQTNMFEYLLWRRDFAGFDTEQPQRSLGQALPVD